MTIEPIDGVIRDAMKGMESRLIWSECKLCHQEYASMPKDGILTDLSDLTSIIRILVDVA